MPLSANHDTTAELNQFVFNFCLQQCEDCMEKASLEDALRWAGVAASLAIKCPFGFLASPRLEELVVRIGRTLPAPDGPGREGRTRVTHMHVLSQAYALYGHTRLCRTWMELDAERAEQNVVLLRQEAAVPQNLVEASEVSGGTVTTFDPAYGLLERARLLRELAFNNADLVILHTHPDDVIPIAAFALPEGPPVILVNHADHIFWVGGSISDLVLDIRPSGHSWTKMHRGVARAAVLPLPLGAEGPGSGDLNNDPGRRTTRKSLGLKQDDVAIMSMGSPYKYRAFDDYDFMTAADLILERAPNAHLLLVGPSQSHASEAITKRRHGRLKVLGEQAGVTDLIKASDVYIEGFPFGSLTALLEAGLCAVPCVRAPQRTMPPYCSDGASLQAVAQPENIAGYVDRVVRLVNNQSLRVDLGLKLQSVIEREHTGVFWRERLHNLLQELPRTHAVYGLSDIKPLEAAQRDYWIDFLTGSTEPRHRENPFHIVFEGVALSQITQDPSKYPRLLWKRILDDEHSHNDRRERSDRWAPYFRHAEIGFYRQKQHWRQLRWETLRCGIVERNVSKAWLLGGLLESLVGTPVWEALRHRVRKH